MLLNLRCQTGKHQHMPRQERTKSGTGIYHVMLRGINKQDIFEDDEDYLQMTDYDAGIRQLSRLTGVSYGVIQKLWTRKKWSQNRPLVTKSPEHVLYTPRNRTLTATRQRQFSSSYWSLFNILIQKYKEILNPPKSKLWFMLGIMLNYPFYSTLFVRKWLTLQLEWNRWHISL